MGKSGTTKGASLMGKPVVGSISMDTMMSDEERVVGRKARDERA